MNEFKATLLSIVVVTLLAACAALDIHKPETFEERVTFVQSTVAEAQEGLKQQILAGTIEKKDARSVDAQLDNAIEALDVTILLRATDPTRAEDRLTAAQGIVTILKDLTEKHNE